MEPRWANEGAGGSNGPKVVSGEKKIALVQLAKHREPRLLVTGQTVSQFGDGVALVALTLLVLDTTGDSASKLAWFVAARMTP